MHPFTLDRPRDLSAAMALRGEITDAISVAGLLALRHVLPDRP